MSADHLEDSSTSFCLFEEIYFSSDPQIPCFYCVYSLRTTRSGAERARSRVLLSSHKGNQNNVISWKLFYFFGVAYGGQNVFFNDIIDIRDELPGPGQARPDLEQILKRS